MKKLTAIAAAVGAVIALASCGTGKANEAVQNVPRPTVTTTTTQTVTVVPQACLDALDNADQGFTYAGQIMNAASQLDADTMNAITDKLTQLAPTYNANKAACRAAGGGQ